MNTSTTSATGAITPSPRHRLRTRTVMRATALALAAGLTLAGCASASTPAATAQVTASTSSSTDSTASSADSASAAPVADSASTTSQTISSTSAAAQAFLATLSQEQREAVLYDYDDATKSTSWSNFPVTFVQRAGLNLSELTEEQRAAALAVLESLLSEEAYATAVGIMEGDEYLLDYSTATESSLGQYYLAFFGDPSETGSWAIQFGGHHLGINADLNGADNAITFAPTHLGVQPASYTNEQGEQVQSFDAIYTDAFAFFNSLTSEQQAALTAGDVTMCSPGDTCEFSTGSGLSGADLTGEQKKLLLELIANWAAMADEETNAAVLAEIEATLDDTVIAWSGQTSYDMSTGEGVSFSISGPRVYIGFQAQEGSAGADVDGVTTSGWGHVHTIYRDPANDYAGSVTQGAASGGMGGAPGAGPGS